MAVSKHNLWKRQKNGLMKLVRSHSEWLEQQREARARVKHIKSGVRTVTTHDQSLTKSNMMSGGTSSAKRTQIGKKV